MGNIKTKICGLTKIVDIEIVNKAKPTYAGFVFASSKRKLESDEAKQLIVLLDKDILPVGVFVNEAVERMVKIALSCKLKVIQLHGQENAETIKHLKIALALVNLADIEVWKAIRVKDESSLSEINQFINTERILLDAWNPHLAGGTGESFNWELLKDLSIPYILAGGLTPANVAEAIRATHPWGVDVSSGVETDGKKCEKKIMNFIARTRSV